MDATASLNDIVGSNIALIDKNIDRKIEFLSRFDGIFDITFIIGCQTHEFREAQIPGIFFKNFEMMDDLFDLQDIFGYKSQKKLFIIYDMESCQKSKTFKSLLVNGSQFNCSIILFDGLDHNLENIKNLKLNVNALIGMFDEDDMIDQVYSTYFTMFPPISIFSDKVKKLYKDNPNNYAYIIKSGKRYHSLDEKFRIFDVNFATIIYTDDKVIDELKDKKIELCVEI